MFCQGNQDSKNQNQSTPKTVQAHQRPETRRLQPDSAAQSAPANPTAVAAENIFPPALETPAQTAIAKNFREAGKKKQM